MNTADLVAEIERLIPCYDGFYAAHCQTGDEYVVFERTGDDEALACQQMRADIKAYIQERRGDGARLFWRFAAERRIDWELLPRKKQPRGRLYTRLVVTHASIIWFSWEEYNQVRTLELERKMLGKPLAS